MAPRVRRAVAVGAALTVAAYVGVLLATPAPGLRHDSAVDVVFDSRWLVAGARLLMAAAMVYLLASIGVRVWRRQWVRSAGTIDTDAGVARLSADRDAVRAQLQHSHRTISALREVVGGTPPHQRVLGPGDQARAALEQADRALLAIHETLQRSDRVESEDVQALRRAGIVR